MTDPKHIQRLEVIIKAPLLGKVVREINACGAKGYTILRAHSGRGERGSWQEGQISPAQHMMLVIVIAEKAVTDEILKGLAENLQHYSGVVTVSDVSVLRPHRF